MEREPSSVKRIVNIYFGSCRLGRLRRPCPSHGFLLALTARFYVDARIEVAVGREPAGRANEHALVEGDLPSKMTAVRAEKDANRKRN